MKKRRKLTRKYPVLLCIAVLCITLISPAEVQAFDKTTAKKNVTVTYTKTSSGILAVYKNKNSTSLKMTATVRFLDGAGKTIQVVKKKNLCLGKKSTAAFFFQAPTDANGNYVNYSSYKKSFSVAKSGYTSYSKKITVSSDIQTTETQFAAVNFSGKTLNNICSVIVFYDSDGEILDCTVKYLNCFEADAVDQFSISYAGKSYQPSSVKVYISWAY